MGLAVGVCCVCRWAVAASMIKTAEQRFVASTAPDGSRWAPNSPATIMHYLRAKGGAFNKRGGLTKRGARLAANKKPLIGERLCGLPRIPGSRRRRANAWPLSRRGQDFVHVDGPRPFGPGAVMIKAFPLRVQRILHMRGRTVGHRGTRSGPECHPRYVPLLLHLHP